MSKVFYVLPCNIFLQQPSISSGRYLCILRHVVKFLFDATPCEISTCFNIRYINRLGCSYCINCEVICGIIWYYRQGVHYKTQLNNTHHYYCDSERYPNEPPPFCTVSHFQCLNKTVGQNIFCLTFIVFKLQCKTEKLRISERSSGGQFLHLLQLQLVF